MNEYIYIGKDFIFLFITAFYFKLAKAPYTILEIDTKDN
jgi:hypothetical protein